MDNSDALWIPWSSLSIPALPLANTKCLWTCTWCLPDHILNHWQPDNWLVTSMQGLVPSSEKYVQCNISRIFPWKRQIYDYNQLKTIQSHLGTNNTHFQIFAHHTWLQNVIFLQQRTNCFSFSLTMAAVIQNSHFSFRFTSSFTVPNLIWSSLEFIKVCVAAVGYDYCCLCLAPVTATA